jgi:hypothetical protein
MNEGEDPVAEIRRYRDENARRFKTVEALVTHLSKTPTAEEWLAAHQNGKAKSARGGKRFASRRRRRTAEA